MAAEFSNRLGWLELKDCERIRKLLVRSNLPVDAPKTLTANDFIQLMSVDKKVRHGVLRLVLLRKIGAAELTNDFDHTLLYNLISEFTAAA